MLERAAAGRRRGHARLRRREQHGPAAPRNLGQLRGDLRTMSAGKGTSDAQARASGLCEGLERYSGRVPGRRAAPPGAMADLGGAAVSLNDCLLFSERQYREREARNAAPRASASSRCPSTPRRRSSGRRSGR